jgi:hypothetical protein
MKVKLVAETLNENVYVKLNEEMNTVSESIFNDFVAGFKKAFQALSKEYEGLNKKDEKAVRKFTWDVTSKTYVSTSPEKGRQSLKHWAEKAPLEMLLKFLEKAAQGKFYGRTYPNFNQGKLQVGWKDLQDIKLGNPFGNKTETTFGGG